MGTKASLGVKRSRGYSVHRALQGPIDTENPEAKDPWPDTHQLEGGYPPRQTQVPLGAAASAPSPPHAHPLVTLPPHSQWPLQTHTDIVTISPKTPLWHYLCPTDLSNNAEEVATSSYDSCILGDWVSAHGLPRSLENSCLFFRPSGTIPFHLVHPLWVEVLQVDIQTAQ